MTSTTSQDRPTGGPADPGGAGRPRLRDRTLLAPLPETVPASAVLLSWLLAGASAAVLCVLAVLLPAPRLVVGPLTVEGGAHDPRVLVFLVLVTLAGSALGIGLVRGALPRAEAAGEAAAVDRSALVVRGARPVVLRLARGWLALVALVLVPAWLGLLPLPVVGLVLPFALAACAPAVVVRRVAGATARRRGLEVLTAGPAAALGGHLLVAGPERPEPAPVVLRGELLEAAPGPRRAGGGSGTAGAARAAGPRSEHPSPGEWGFQPAPGGGHG